MANMLGDAIHRRRRGTMDWITGLQLDLQFTNLAKLFQDSAGTVPVTTIGQPIGRVLDSSPNNNHFSQATGTKRPTYQSGGALFDGVDDVLAGLGTGLNTNDKTVFVGLNPGSSPGSTRGLFSSGSSIYYVGVGSTLSSLASWNNTTPIQKTRSTAKLFTVGVYAKSATRWAVSGVNVDLLQRADGVALSVPSYTDGMTTPASAAYFVGGLNATPGSPFHGTIRRILVYNRALSDSEIAEIEALI